MDVSFQLMWIDTKEYPLTYSFNIPRSMTAGSYGESMSNSTRNRPTDFRSGCPVVRPHRQWWELLLLYSLAGLWCYLWILPAETHVDCRYRCLTVSSLIWMPVISSPRINTLAGMPSTGWINTVMEEDILVLFLVAGEQHCLSLWGVMLAEIML